MEDEVQIIDPPSYQFVPSLNGNYWVKVELVTGTTRVDGYSNREMIYHRTSYSSSVTGEYETLYSVPFGLQAVSGDNL